LIISVSTLVAAQTMVPGEMISRLEPGLRIPSASTPYDRSSTTPSYRRHNFDAGSASLHLLVVTEDLTDLAALGFDVNSRIGSVSTVVIAPNRLHDLARIPGVRFIQEAGKETASSYSNTLLMGVVDIHHGALSTGPVTGQGVLMAIYDSGIDLTSPLFRDATDTTRTRIVGVWDQTLSTPELHPPEGFTYGSELLQPDLDGRIISGQIPLGFGEDRTGHGTGVTAIAAGGGDEIGIAPEASILVIKGGDGRFSESGIVDALNYIDGVATRLGMPVVVNLSIGSHRGPHSGTRVYEKAIDAFSSNPGRVVVVAAGNDGHDPLHAEALLTSYLDSIEIPWVIPSYLPHAGDTNDKMTMEMWYDADDSLAVTILSPNGHEIRAATGSPYAVSTNQDGVLFIDNATFVPSPVHGKNLGFIHLSDFRD